MLLILQAVYYFLPVFFANMAPTFLSKLPFWNQSIDFGKKYKEKRLLGDHKTIRGFVFACILGTLIFFFQKQLYNYDFVQKISLINYNEYSLWLGFLLAFGAIFGDLAESFIKRRRNIAPGKAWMPFDQLDYIIGALIFSFFIFIPSLNVILLLFVLGFVLQIFFHYLGFVLGINKDKI